METIEQYYKAYKELSDSVDALRKEIEIGKMLAEFKHTRSIAMAVDICDKLLEEDN